MEIHQSAVILLLILSVSSFTHGQPALYHNFLDRHRCPDMNEQQCDSKIKERHITDFDNYCTDINTFIQASETDIKAVCSKKGGTPLNDYLFNSTKTFPVVICKLCNFQKCKKFPDCKYIGFKENRHIVLKCDNGWPVDYQEQPC